MKMKHYGSSPSVKPKTGMAGGWGSTPSSNAGASGRSYTDGKFPTKSKQKAMKQSGNPARNLVHPCSPGNKGY